MGTVWLIGRSPMCGPSGCERGMNDGSMTAVEGDGLKEGIKIVTGTLTKAEAKENTGNPFAAQFMRRRPSSGSR